MKASRDDEVLWIGQVASAFGVAPHTLRHWEAMGLLAPPRDAAGGRRYRRQDCLRVAAVVRAKAAGLALEQIRDLLRSGPGDRARVLEGQRDRLRGRTREAERSLALVETVLECRHGDVASCPRFSELLDDDLGAALNR